MSESKRAMYKAVLSEGLRSANKGNIFWSRSDAMSAFAAFHRNNKGA